MDSLKGKSFLKLLDLSPEQISGLLDLAADLKAKKKAGIRPDEDVKLQRFEVIRHR